MMIRPVREDDVDSVAALWRELVAFHQALDENLPTPAADGAYRYAQRIRYGIDDSHVQTYIAEVDGKIVGYVLGTIIDLLPEMFEEEKAGMVADIYVQKSHRSQGIGQALMKQMLNWFKLRGVSHYEWYVASKNSAGIRFWRDVMGGESVMIRMRAPIDDSNDS
jgi:ribosomal protein S18 acetylase RimI-like enzyme